MERYDCKKVVGRGTYGSVATARPTDCVRHQDHHPGHSLEAKLNWSDKRLDCWHLMAPASSPIPVWKEKLARRPSLRVIVLFGRIWNVGSETKTATQEAPEGTASEFSGKRAWLWNMCMLTE